MIAERKAERARARLEQAQQECVENRDEYEREEEAEYEHDHDDASRFQIVTQIIESFCIFFTQ